MWDDQIIYTGQCNIVTDSDKSIERKYIFFNCSYCSAPQYLSQFYLSTSLTNYTQIICLIIKDLKWMWSTVIELQIIGGERITCNYYLKELFLHVTYASVYSIV